MFSKVIKDFKLKLDHILLKFTFTDYLYYFLIFQMLVKFVF